MSGQSLDNSDLGALRSNKTVYNGASPVGLTCQHGISNWTNCTKSLYENTDADYLSPFDWISVKVIFICLYGLVFLMCFIGKHDPKDSCSSCVLQVSLCLLTRVPRVFYG
jgi:hypothetical protein